MIAISCLLKPNICRSFFLSNSQLGFTNPCFFDLANLSFRLHVVTGPDIGCHDVTDRRVDPNYAVTVFIR